MRAGRRQTLVVGTGHGTCTFEGAAFEHTFNVEHELREAGVRETADLVYLSNGYELGGFRVGGMVVTQKGFQTSSRTWTESLFRERGIRAITGAHVERIEPGVIHHEQLDGTRNELRFDFAMLLPPFRGADLLAFDAAGEDITADLFAPNGFMKVDADFTAKPYEQGAPRTGRLAQGHCCGHDQVPHRSGLRGAPRDRPGLISWSRHGGSPP